DRQGPPRLGTDPLPNHRPGDLQGKERIAVRDPMEADEDRTGKIRTGPFSQEPAELVLRHGTQPEPNDVLERPIDPDRVALRARPEAQGGDHAYASVGQAAKGEGERPGR